MKELREISSSKSSGIRITLFTGEKEEEKNTLSMKRTRDQALQREGSSGALLLDEVVIVDEAEVEAAIQVEFFSMLLQMRAIRILQSLPKK